MVLKSTRPPCVVKCKTKKFTAPDVQSPVCVCVYSISSKKKVVSLSLQKPSLFVFRDDNEHTDASVDKSAEGTT